MKIKLLACLVGVACMVSAPVFAESFCEAMSELATTIMKARQAGASMAAMMNVVDKQDCRKDPNKPLCEALKKAQRALIVEAYEKPRFSTEAFKQKEIKDFSDDAYLQCYKAHH